MELSNSFEGFARSYGFQGNERGGSSTTTTSSSLVLDSEKGELVRTMVRPGQKAVNEEKALLALRNHSEAERRRRERINGHLATLRSLIPGTDKMDKAALLGEVISSLKEMRKNAAEATKGLLVPMDIDEVRVEQQEPEGSDGAAANSIMASLCCDYKQEILSDLRQALESLDLKTVKTEIATLGSRMLNVFVVTGGKEGSVAGDGNQGTQLLASSIKQALRSVLDRFYASQEFSARTSLSNKRRRISFLNAPTSSSSLGDFW